MAGMRDILIHEYFDIDLSLTWAVVKRELPSLKENLQTLKDGHFFQTNRVSCRSKVPCLLSLFVAFETALLRPIYQYCLRSAVPKSKNRYLSGLVFQKCSKI